MRILSLLLLIYSSVSFAQTVEELTQSAQNDNVHAQLELADRYSQGQGVQQSSSEAFYWYQQAASNGSDSAAANLGRAYYKGLGTKVDIENAIFWLSKAALTGDKQAPLLLGQLYEQAKEQPDNLDLAELWYEQAAKENPDAEKDYARVLEQQFNNRRAKQVAAIDQLEVAFDHQDIELSPKAKSIAHQGQAQSTTIYALIGLLVLSIALIIWLLRINRSLRVLTDSSDSGAQRQQVKLDREIRRKDETLKQQKRQMEAMYRHIKKLQSQPKPTAKPQSAAQDKPITLACTLFGFNPAKIPDEKQIKLRYKQLCKIYHPDLKGSEEEMKRLNQALKVILKHVNK
ncbi:J domain-containing protein [Vibrio europaeus]|uniref:J domain-containing protein n=1 Tax=Vibrio europaeus TaxID=300876 RepID=UPI00148B9355|nr:J domain-containing protein [Vibrio europaeus]NOH23258.1 J domain-containing protein [Vibrio europaeus]